MKTIFSIALAGFAAAAFTACGGTKNTTVSTPASGEFDPNTGAWKPLTKVVAPAPHERGAVITEQKKPGMLDKVGTTLKKPLKWIGLGKEEPAAQADTATPAAPATAKPAPKPQH